MLLPIDAHGSVVHCKEAELTIDTDLQGRADALNPAKLLLAAVAACILKNMERIAPMIQFAYRGVTVEVHGVRQDAPPKMLNINIRKYGTAYNTVAPGTES